MKNIIIDTENEEMMALIRRSMLIGMSCGVALAFFLQVTSIYVFHVNFAEIIFGPWHPKTANENKKANKIICTIKVQKGDDGVEIKETLATSIETAVVEIDSENNKNDSEVVQQKQQEPSQITTPTPITISSEPLCSHEVGTKVDITSEKCVEAQELSPITTPTPIISCEASCSDEIGTEA